MREVAQVTGCHGSDPRRYLDEEIVRDPARRMLVEVVNEPPGCDLVDLPGTTPMPLIPIGSVAALAEAMQVHAANEPADRREPWGEQNA